MARGPFFGEEVLALLKGIRDDAFADKALRNKANSILLDHAVVIGKIESLIIGRDKKTANGE